MTPTEEVMESLQSFAGSCSENERLSMMNRDWNRIIHIHATDLGQDFTLRSRDGLVSAQPGKPDGPDMTILATAEILTQVFFGEVSPNEPYNNGTLRVQGSEADIVHLDFITAMLWE